MSCPYLGESPESQSREGILGVSLVAHRMGLYLKWSPVVRAGALVFGGYPGTQRRGRGMPYVGLVVLSGE